MQGTIFNIQRFSIHDGPSIRTAVFLKGCPLRCAWCHNPEGLSRGPVLSYIADKCVGCGACAAACPDGAHIFESGRHVIRRESCAASGACVRACSSGALEIMGRTYTVDEVVKAALRDRAFYRDGGGVTLTGGEPLMQGGFAVAIARALHAQGVSVCVETSGFAERRVLEEIAPYVDIFLFDIKETDEERHRQYTGVGLAKIRENLRWLDDGGARTILRCPVIPGVNDRSGHFDEIARLAESMRHVLEIDIEPYHPMGIDKSRRVGMQAAYRNAEFMDASATEQWRAYLAARTRVKVVIS